MMSDPRRLRTYPPLLLLLAFVGSTVAAPLDVTGTADSGAGSLREAIGAVGAGGTITLQPGSAGTITLESQLAPLPVGVVTLSLNNGAGANTVVAGTSTAFSGIGGAITVAAGASPGTLTLVAPNTYQGTTTVQGGTLALGASERVPNTSRLVVASPGTFDLGGFDETVLALSGNGTVRSSAGGSTLTIVGSDVTSFGGSLTGPVSLVLSGTGRLNLEGTNTYTGATIVGAGTLGISGPAPLPVGTNLTIGAGAVVQSDNSLRIGTLSGEGEMRMGGVPVPTLTIDHASNATFEGDIPNVGGELQVFKEGTGIQHFSGTYLYSGPTTVNGGTLVVDAGGLFMSGFQVNSGSTLVVDGVIVNSVTVASGGTVGGNGGIVQLEGPGLTVLGGGTVSPGTSIGTFNVVGAYEQRPGSVYRCEVLGSSESDLISVSDGATLGGTVQVVSLGGTYRATNRYTILQSGPPEGPDALPEAVPQVLTGTFAGVTDDLPLFASSLSYEANDVVLTLQLLQNPFQTLLDGQANPNRTAIARALDSGLALKFDDPQWAGLFSQLLGLTPAGLAAAFDQISPEVHTGATQGALWSSQSLLTLAMRQLGASREHAGNLGESGGQPNAGGPAVARAGAGWAGAANLCSGLPAFDARGRPVADNAVWVLGAGQFGDVDPTSATLGFDYSGGAVLAGRTFRSSPSLSFGVHGGYTKTEVKRRSSQDRTRIDGYQLGLHGSWHSGPSYVDGVLNYTRHDYDSQRLISFAATNAAAAGEYRGEDVALYLETGRVFEVGTKTYLQPHLGFLGRHLEEDPFAETGAGLLNLTYAGNEVDQRQGVLGLRLFKRIKARSGDWFVPELALRWGHEFGDVGRTVTAWLGCSPDSFVVTGRSVDRDTAQVRAGLAAFRKDDVDMNVSYNGEFGSGVSGQAVVGRVTWRW